MVDKTDVARENNLWDYGDDTIDHPYPGTYPSPYGWCISGQQYRQNPKRAEAQAIIIAKALVEAGY